MLSIGGLIALALVVVGILILAHTLAAATWLGVLLLIAGLLLLFGGGYYGYGRGRRLP